MNPWAIAGGVVVLGGLVFASQAAAADDGCEIDLEYGFPYWLCAVMIRRCIDEDGVTSWLWDVADLDEVSFAAVPPSPGSPPAIDDWPDRSLGFGQAPTELAANEAAIAWVDAHQDFVLSGGERGPLAQRTDDFIAALSPTEHADLLAIFDAIDGRIVGWVDEMRVAPTDEEFLHIGKSVAAVVGRADQDKLQADILDAIGFSHGFTLKSLLEDAGVL